MKKILVVFILLFNFCLFGQNNDILIPNSFTPTKETNKEFFPVTTLEYRMEIYNRWGELIFKGDRWDGKHNNTICDVGTYIWVIYTPEKKYTGHINLIN
ncbi:MAG: hypothetical protein GTN59_02290 [Candidatus Dadabacteria bacterium]|nr:hypothetical protein [Candidatus Dadabacteria bacterium]